MKTSYKQKLFLYFVMIFALFTIGVFLFEQSREREHKTEALEEKLDAFADIVNTVLVQHENNLATSVQIDTNIFVKDSCISNKENILNSLTTILPPNIRLTLIDWQGQVLYDNEIKETFQMENHAQRPEIKTAREAGKGYNIRVSSSNEKKYLYYAKQFNDNYIRVALPYDIQMRHFLKPDNLFLYFIIVFFVVMLFFINYVSGRFGKSIKQLRDFTCLIENGEWKMENVKNSQFSILNSQFPKDELGEISQKIAENYLQLKESKKEIALEREKLLQHVHSSEEGLCFFSADKSVEFYNGLFIQYLNIIIDEADSNLQNVFTDISFEKTASFITNREKTDTYFETQINKQGRTFVVRVNVFDDDSFEIIINDMTKQEKMRLMKQEMTGNITHELRTPVTGIRGCLETILEHPLEPEKKQYFIESAYNQALALSELIQDMSLITKVEEAPQSFKSESVDMGTLLENLKKDLEIPLQEKEIKMEWNLTGQIIVKGNRNLLYSIFRNLTDNVIRYAGTSVNIFIKKYNEDKDFYYFSYSDTGIGISEEQDLNRIFERFYRINEGRTRDTGGSGLGLSIVKNAIAFHKGTIVAKNKADGGLEFLFTLKKQ